MRLVSIGAPMATQTLTGAIGIAHAIAASAFIWITLFVGYLISLETVGIDIGDRVLPIPVLDVTSD